MIEKAVNIKIKVSFKPLLTTRKIDSKYLKSYRLATKIKLIEITKTIIWIKIKIKLLKTLLLLISINPILKLLKKNIYIIKQIIKTIY